MIKEKRLGFEKSKDLKNLLMVIVGALLIAMAVNFFAEPAGLLPSGFSGLAFLLIDITESLFNIKLSYSIVYFLLNLPVGLLVYNSIGKKFTIFSLIQVAFTSLFSVILPEFIITDNIILAAIFGGILSALGTVLSLKANASTGGMDFLAIYFSNKLNKPTWGYVLVFNALILSTSGLLFSIDKALFSIIYQFSNTQTIDKFHDRYKLTSLHIVTSKPEPLTHEIMERLNRGITKMDALGCYNNEKRYVLYLIVNAYEAADVIELCKQHDENIFIAETRVNRIIGNFYQEPYE